MQTKRFVLFILFFLLIVTYPLSADQNDALRIVALEDKVAELQNRYSDSENKRIELQEKIIKAQTEQIKAQTEQIKVKTDNLKLELKDYYRSWLYGLLVGGVGIIALLGGIFWATLKHQVRNQVVTQIAGEKDKFDDALEDIKVIQKEVIKTRQEARKEAELTKNELVQLHQNVTYSFLAGSENLSPEMVLNILENPHVETAPRAKNSALDIFGRAKYKPAIPYAVKMLGDEIDGVREFAARALAAIGEPAVPALIKALGDEIDGVREFAARALGGIGTSEALKAVEKYEQRR